MPRRPTRPWQPERYGADSKNATVRGSRRGPRTHRVDLHGYDVLTAVDLARLSVSEAYLNGYSYVELLHGAADVTEPVAAGAGARGGIKWELRRMLERGEFDSWCRSHHEHALLEGMMRLALRPNPTQRGEEWTPMPPPRRGA
jgi:hypothetical protein